MKEWPLLHLFVFMIIYLFRQGLMDIYIILLIIIPYSCLFCYTYCFRFDHCELLQFGKCVFQNDTLIFKPLLYFLYKNILGSSCTFFSYFSIGSTISPEIWFLLLEKDVQKPRSGHQVCSLLLFSSFLQEHSVDRVRKCYVCLVTQIYTHLHLSLHLPI